VKNGSHNFTAWFYIVFPEEHFIFFKPEARLVGLICPDPQVESSCMQIGGGLVGGDTHSVGTHQGSEIFTTGNLDSIFSGADRIIPVKYWFVCERVGPIAWQAQDWQGNENVEGTHRRPSTTLITHVTRFYMPEEFYSAD
jgi:hypothetical protein